MLRGLMSKIRLFGPVKFVVATAESQNLKKEGTIEDLLFDRNPPRKFDPLQAGDYLRK